MDCVHRGLLLSPSKGYVCPCKWCSFLCLLAHAPHSMDQHLVGTAGRGERVSDQVHRKEENRERRVAYTGTQLLHNVCALISTAYSFCPFWGSAAIWKRLSVNTQYTESHQTVMSWLLQGNNCDLWVWCVHAVLHGTHLTFSKLILPLQVPCSNQLHIDQCIGLGTWSAAELPTGNT